MKKYLSIVLTAVLAFAVFVPAQAQSLGRLHQNEIALSYG